jgi:hypothetical protein
MYASNGQHQPTQMALVTPVVFCAKATEKRNKNTKISWWLPKKTFITICRTPVRVMEGMRG